MAKKGQYVYEYPHPALTADNVVFGYDGKELKVLLIKRGVEKEASTKAFVGFWALPGGFMDVEADETIAHTAARELKEETGLKLDVKEFKEVGTFSHIDRDPRERVITVAHYALVKLAQVEPDTDAEKAEWTSLKDIPRLAFDHDQILRIATRELRRQIHFEPVGFELLPKQFTMKELQTLYEAILDVKFDRRNFYKKMQHLELLTQVNDTTSTRKQPFIFEFNSEKYKELKHRGFRLEF